MRRMSTGSMARAPKLAPGHNGSCGGYFAMSSIWSTAAFTRSSDRSARPPLAGITPALPWKPLRAWSYSTSLPQWSKPGSFQISMTHEAVAGALEGYIDHGTDEKHFGSVGLVSTRQNERGEEDDKLMR